MKPQEQRILNEALIELNTELEEATRREGAARLEHEARQAERVKIGERRSQAAKIMAAVVCGSHVTTTMKRQDDGGLSFLIFRSHNDCIEVAVRDSDRGRSFEFAAKDGSNP